MKPNSPFIPEHVIIVLDYHIIHHLTYLLFDLPLTGLLASVICC
jgi:hypothetical protein